LFNREGEAVSTHQLEHRQIYPRPGWVEHDPEEIWSRTADVIRGAMEKANLSPDAVAAVGVTNQRETTVVWDRKTGRPYGNAIVWQDTRTDGIVADLAREGGIDRLRAKTGLPLATYFSGPKLQCLLDLETLDWDDEILRLLRIPRSMLPRIRPSSDPELYGATQKDGPFGGSIPVCGDVGDQQAALLGQGCFDAGEAKNTYGTGCFLLMNTGSSRVPSRSGLLTTVAYQLGGRPAVYALEGSVAIAGALVQWLRDNLGLVSSAAEVEALAGSVEDNGGMVLVPAFSGLFAPHWRSDARGVMVGLTRYITKGHIARASLEASAFQTQEVLDAMQRDSGVTLKTLRVDGGMVRNELLMQFQADLLGVPVVRPRITETTSMGAAYAAGLAVGFWADENELRSHWQADRSWEPRISPSERERLRALWAKAVERTLGWVER
jgi:glycerol kinase